MFMELSLGELHRRRDAKFENGSRPMCEVFVGRHWPISKSIVLQQDRWRATLDEDGHYRFAIPL
jgi:hypothetical protein